MKILFMGTTDFAVSCLDAILTAGYPVAAVCTKVDRPKNRGMKLAFSPVKEYAMKRGIPVLQPSTLKSEETEAALRAVGADLFVVVAYGKLLPREVLELPPLGCVNVHASLLPKYRGAAPIQWAVMNGERETGVSIMYLSEAMDAGDVISAASLEIRRGESFGSVYERLKSLGGELLVKTLPALEQGTAKAVPQREAEVTYAPPITREHCRIDWTCPAEQVFSRICGLDPKPGARALLGGTEFKIFSPEAAEQRSELPPGSILSAGKGRLEVVCGDGGVLRIRELQAPGGKRMKTEDYLRGHSLP